MPSQFLDLAHHNEAALTQTLTDLVKFPSISPGNQNKDDCLACVAYLEQKLTQSEFVTRRIPVVDGNPILFAERHIGTDKPTVVFYGHYDVQMPGNAEDWKSGDPFCLKLESDDRFYGRGAQDNKGQVTYVLNAIEALRKEGLLHCNIKVILEGEEEIGSPGLAQQASELGELIKGDILLVCDTGAPALGRIGICLSLRGIAMNVFSVHGPAKALHSGLFGGMGANPLVGMAQIISSFFNADGSFAVKGFADSVRDISPDDAARIMAGAKRDAELCKFTGWKTLDGEPGFSPQLRASLRPAIEFTVLEGGAMGQNSIPTTARTRIAARLAPGQDPTTVAGQIREHIKTHMPRGLTVKIESERAMPGLYLNANDASVELAIKAIEEVTGQAPGYEYGGGSIPIIPALAQASGATPLLIGAGLDEDNIHEVNESFARQQMLLGFATICEVLSRLK